MADFFTRLVSRTLSVLEPTVKPLIAPMYASGVTMADNYAVDSASEWGLSVSEEYASTESAMEQSPELLGISTAETLNFASNVPLINWREIQLSNHFSEIASSEPFQPDSAIAPEDAIKTSSSRESSPPIAPSIPPSTTIQKITSQNTVNVTPTSKETIQPLENSSEISSSEPLQPDRAIAPEDAIKTSSSGESSLPIATSIKPSNVIQKLSSQEPVNVTPTPLETIQSLDNPSEIASGEPLEAGRAIAPESSIKTSSTEESSSPITPSITSLNTIQKSTSQDTVNVTPTSQPLEKSSSEPLQLDSASIPESSIKTSPSEESSLPITPSITPLNTIQKSTSQDTVNVNPTSLETIQPLDKPSEITSSEPLQPDSVLASESSIKDSSSRELSLPIAPSIAPPTNIQKSTSQNTVNVTPTSLETIQSLDNPSERTVGEPLQPDSAFAPESSIKDSYSRESSPHIAPSITPPSNIQKSTSQDTVNVTPTIQPLEKSSSEPFQPDSTLTSESSINTSVSRELSPPIAPSITPATNIQKSTSQDTVNVNPTSLETIQPLYNPSEIASSEPFNPKSSIAEESFLLQPNNQSSQVISRQVSLPLVALEVVAPLSSLPLNPPGQVEPPVNRVESIQPIESDIAFESNSLATYSSFPKSDLADTAPSTSSSPSPKSFPPPNAVKNQIFPLVQSGEARIMRLPIASETVSRSPGSSEIKTGTIEPQNTFLSQPSNSQEISSPDTMTPIPFTKGELTHQLLTDTNPNKSMTTITNSQNFRAQEEKISNPSRLGITTQSKLVAEGVQPQPVAQHKGEKIDSNLSSIGNTFSSLVAKDLTRHGPRLEGQQTLMRPRLADLFENASPRLRQTESIPLKIEPRLEITRQELFQSPEQLPELPFPSNSQSSSRQSSQTGGLETANSSPRKIANTNPESTPTINVTIGRVEVRGIKPREPPPLKKSRAKTPQLSLSDYLKQRGGQ